ncbi:unnamed protein product [Allacma fusca]|uniref:Uncharacterized protein n=1 Tax=Allacma fusca TaxID=39272 RepID=A0A8J2JY88_9HEXA|nr:unnamed protein product [Allacma fusca]
MDKKYAVVLWSDHFTNNSSVKVSKIKCGKNVFKTENDLVWPLFNITIDGEDFVGKVIHVGSRARMSQSAANLASDAAEASIMETKSFPKGLRNRKLEGTTLAVATNDEPTNGNETNTGLQDAHIDNQDDNPDKIILLDQPLLPVEVNSLEVQILEKEEIIVSEIETARKG